MRFKKALVKLLVIILVLSNLMPTTVFSDVDEDSFALDYVTIESIKRLLHIKEGVFSQEIKEELDKNISMLEVHGDKANDTFKAGIRMYIGEKGVSIVNKSILEDRDGFREINASSKIVANISPYEDLAVLISKPYSGMKGLPIRDYKDLQTDEPLYSISWQSQECPIANPGKYTGIKIIDDMEYICMKGAKYFGTVGSVLVDKNGKALGLSANIAEDEYTYYIPLSKHEGLINDKNVEFLIDLGMEVEDVFDDIDLEFRSSSMYDGSKLKIAYNVIITTKNSEAYRKKIGDDAFKNKLADYFTNMVKSKANLYGIKDYDFYLNLRHYILTQEIRDGEVVSKEWTVSKNRATYIINEIDSKSETVKVDNNSIVVDKLGKLSKITTITEALSQAAPGSKIVIEPGIYNESLLINKSDIELYGKAGAIIEGEGKNTLTIDSENVKISNIEFKNKSKDNEEVLYIKKGKPNISHCVIKGNGGAGIRIVDESNPEIVDNIIKSCVDGIVVADKSGAVIKSNFVSQNEQSGIKVSSNGKTIIKYNYISKNEQYGIMADNAKQLVIFNNNIDKNQISGITAGKGCELRISNNRIQDNGNGVEIYDSSKADIIDNIVGFNRMNGIHVGTSSVSDLLSNFISNNKMTGIYINGIAKVFVEKTRVVKNKSQGIVVEGSSHAEILNSTIANNGNSGIFFDFRSEGSIENNTVYGNKPRDIDLESSVNIMMKDNKVLNR